MQLGMSIPQHETELIAMSESLEQQATKLPKRSVDELVQALRVRADSLTGEKWEAPATAAMMREAAEALQRVQAETAAALAAKEGEAEAVRAELEAERLRSKALQESVDNCAGRVAELAARLRADRPAAQDHGWQ